MAADRIPEKRADAAADIAAVIGEWQFRAAVLHADDPWCHPDGPRSRALRIKLAYEQLGFDVPMIDGNILRPPKVRNPALRAGMARRYGEQMLRASWRIRTFANIMLREAEDLAPREGRFGNSPATPGRPTKDAFKQLRVRLESRWETTFGVRGGRRYAPELADVGGEKLAASASNRVWEILRQHCGSPVANPRDGARAALDAIAPDLDVERFLSPQELEALRSEGE